MLSVSLHLSRCVCSRIGRVSTINGTVNIQIERYINYNKYREFWNKRCLVCVCVTNPCYFIVSLSFTDCRQDSS